MKPSYSPTQNCRHCRYYTPEGRRGGYCQQLNVAVQGSWKACALALPPFVPAWEGLEGIVAWQARSRLLVEAVPASEMSDREIFTGEPSIA